MTALTYAKLVDATPNVANVSDRDARFPTPDKFQKVYVQSANEIQQWDGASWQVIIDGNSSTSASLGYYNVVQYGAVGNGVTDDTAAIQAAADAAKAAKGVLYFPAGRYLISASIDLDYTDSADWDPALTILGTAPGFDSTGAAGGSVLLPTNAVTGPALNITGVANTDNSFKGQVNGLTIENLGIFGVSGGTNGDGIYVKYFANVTIRNVWVRNCQDAVQLDRQANGVTFGYGLGVTVDRLFAVANRGWGFRMADAGSISCTMLNPLFQSNTLGGVWAAGAPLNIFGGEFYGNGGPGLQHDEPTGSSAIFGPVCIGTRFESNNTGTLGPQVLLNSSTNPTFDGCWFLTSTNGEHGIQLGEDATYFVRNCVVMNCLFNGKSAVVTQRAMVMGAKATNVVFQNNRTLNYTTVFGGTAGMGTDTQYSLGNEWYNRLNIILASVTRAYAVLQTGDVQPRMSVNANGDISWGPGGSTAVDTVMRRDTADRILVEAGDSFRINDGTWNGGKLISGAQRIWMDATGSFFRYKGSNPASDGDGVAFGSIGPIVTKTTTYTTTANDGTVFVDGTSGGWTLSLLSAVGVPGLMVRVIKIDSSANAVVIDPASTQTVNGNTTYTLSLQWQGVILQSDGANWVIVASTGGKPSSTVTSAAPTGTASATAVMMGLAGSITPRVTGTVLFTVSGQMANTTVNDGATVDLRTGTGAAPTNGTAVTGTQRGVSQTMTSLTAAQRSGFSISFPVTGLTLGTAVWYDVSLLAVTAGTANVFGVTASAVEV